MSLKITRLPEQNQLLIESPFHPSFPQAARKLGGTWKKPAWAFDLRNEKEVEALCRQIYGLWDAPEGGELVSLEVLLAPHDPEKDPQKLNYASWPVQDDVLVGGRVVAHATGRDSGVRLGEGVSLLSGKIDSGGSMKNWRVLVWPGTVLRVHDVPRAKAEEALKQFPGSKILEASGGTDPEPKEETTQRLIAERERLLVRLAEIDAQLDEIQAA
jgi:hypothetical protein